MYVLVQRVIKSVMVLNEQDTYLQERIAKSGDKVTPNSTLSKIISRTQTGIRTHTRIDKHTHTQAHAHTHTHSITHPQLHAGQDDTSECLSEHLFGTAQESQYSERGRSCHQGLGPSPLVVSRNLCPSDPSSHAFASFCLQPFVSS